MALSFALLTAASDGNNQESYTTASHSVTGGKLVVLLYQGAVGSGAPEDITPSGHGTTWTERADLTYDTIRRLFVWTGVPPAPSTGTVTFSAGVGNGQVVGSWAIIEVTDADLTTPVVQAPTDDVGNGLTFAITLAAPASASNRVLGWAAKWAPGTLTKGALFTELSNQTSGSPAIVEQSQFSTAAFQTVCDWSHTSTSTAWGGVALEIAEVAAGAVTGTIAVTQGSQTMSASGTVTNPAPPFVPSDNRIGGIGAIRKPPRN